MHGIKWKWSAAAIMLVITGCGDTDYDKLEPREGDANTVDCVDCGDWEIGESGDDPVEVEESPNSDEQQGGSENQNPPQQPESSTDPVAVQGPCMPEAVARDGERIPTPPEEALAASCPLEKEVRTNGATWLTSEVVTDWEWDGNTLEKSIAESDGSSTYTSFEFDASREHILRIEKREDRIYSSTFSDTYYDYVWEFDERGRTTYQHLEYGELHGSQEEFVGTSGFHQEWEGDRLVRRGHPDNPSEYEWKYDEAGRLIEVSRTPNVVDQAIDRAVWSYRGDDPVQVERYVDGVLVQRQQWEYDEERALVGRQFEAEARGLDGEIEDGANTASRPLDSYELVVPSARLEYEPTTDPWAASNAHLHSDAGDDCYRLPTTMHHGYPVDENAYHLGLAAEDEITAEIRAGYGHEGYYYGYGQVNWYGHVGIGTAWSEMFRHGGRPVGSALTTIAYDDEGRMIEETVEFSARTRDDERAITMREREFGASGLLHDQLTVESGDELASAELLFDRDDTGRIFERRRMVEGELVSQARWSYGGSDAAVEIQVEAAPEQVFPFSDPFEYYSPHPQPDFLLEDVTEEMEHTLTLLREFDQQGREVFYGGQLHQGTHWHAAVETTWGEHGKLEEIDRYNLESGREMRTVWEYDEAGRMIRKAEYDTEGQEIDETWFEYDEAGRLVEKLEEKRGELYVHKEWEYACSN